MDKDAMITYLIGELKKENLELHEFDCSRRARRKSRNS